MKCKYAFTYIGVDLDHAISQAATERHMCPSCRVVYLSERCRGRIYFGRRISGDRHVTPQPPFLHPIMAFVGPMGADFHDLRQGLELPQDRLAFRRRTGGVASRFVERPFVPPGERALNQYSTISSGSNFRTVRKLYGKHVRQPRRTMAARANVFGRPFGCIRPFPWNASPFTKTRWDV